jgi:hypothetical protein
MKLYDFSIYAERRKERQAAEAVVSTVAFINNPGAVVELKVRVNDWFDLHREVLRRASS